MAIIPIMIIQIMPNDETELICKTSCLRNDVRRMRGKPENPESKFQHGAIYQEILFNSNG